MARTIDADLSTGTLFLPNHKSSLPEHPQLTHSTDMQVVSHVQREEGDWYLNTLMLAGVDAPFRYKRKKLYRNLKGARVNLSYYPEQTEVAGVPFEVMKVVRLRRS